MKRLPVTGKLISRLIIIWMIKLYKYFLSPLLPQSCRFYPSCSQYAMEAIAHYGVWKGGIMAAWRLLRCNPFSDGGFDPVIVGQQSQCRQHCGR
ncbi:MAG: membrane protein insertion efficiency factor YidD [Nitrospirae bacterium]|nr:membrane protein insertion efficiency factor YidD [Nitrospirota bacterium]